MSRSRNWRCVCVIASLGLVLSVCASGGRAADHWWTDPGGGVFADPNKWDPLAVPGPDDRAVFDLPDTYAVTFDADHANDQLLVSHGDVSFDLGGWTYTLTHPWTGVGSVTIADDVGVPDDARLTVTNGNVTTNEIEIAPWSEDTGELVVGQGAHWTAFMHFFQIGVRGLGKLTVTDGGIIEYGNGSLGLWAGSTGVIDVAGDGSYWHVTGQFDFGYEGRASMTVREGAHCQTGHCYMAKQAAGTSEAVVDGDGSLWEIFGAQGEGSLVVGGNGSASITVRNGGRLTNSGITYVGENAGATGIVTVTGAGSTLETGDFVVVGNSGAGTLAVADGGAARIRQDLDIGMNAEDSSVGLVSVSGAGSQVAVGNLLAVGRYGDGAAVISDGATLSASGASVAAGGDSSGSVMVSGAGSKFTSDAQVQIGDMGSGSLMVVAGGRAEITDGGHCFIGHNTGSRGTVIVSGLGSTLAVDGMLYVAGHGSGSPGGEASLTVTDGGQVTAGILRVFPDGEVAIRGCGIDANDVMIEEGAEFIIDAGTLRSDTSVGNGGLIQMTSPFACIEAQVVENMGEIAGSGRIRADVTNRPDGAIIAPPGGVLLTEGTVTNNGEIRLYGGTIVVDDLINDTGGLIVGHGSLGGGRVVNSASMTFSGVADLSVVVENSFAGAILVTGFGPTTFYQEVDNEGEIRVSAGCAAVYLDDVTGTGTFTGQGTHYFEGPLKPGSSTAAVSFEGSVAFADTASLHVEIGGTAPGSGYDQVNVGGNAALDGALAIALIDPFEPAVGEAFGVMTYGSRTGEFAECTGWNLGDRAMVPDYRPAELVLVTTYPGDATLNLKVDYVDLGVLATNYDQTGMGWTEGDFTGNGVVDYVDLGILATYYDAGTKGAAVPEPAAVALLALGAGAAIRRRRRQTGPGPAGSW